jgi:Spy/CpxP family protein refolding chaperone
MPRNEEEQVMQIWKLFVWIMVLSAPALTQTVEVKAKPLTDADIQLLRQDLQSQKNQIITDTMSFTESEAAAFWPVYKEYASAQQAIAAKRLNLIVDYAQNLGSLDDNKARDLSQRMFAIEDDTQALRKKYYPRFEKALGAKRAAKFYQVDNRLSMLINVQLTSEIPLIP